MWEEEDGVRTQVDEGGKSPLTFSDHRLDTCLPFGQQVVRHVFLWSTDTVVNKE